jgi:hypothetical protein
MYNENPEVETKLKKFTDSEKTIVKDLYFATAKDTLEEFIAHDLTTNANLKDFDVQGSTVQPLINEIEKEYDDALLDADTLMKQTVSSTKTVLKNRMKTANKKYLDKICNRAGSWENFKAHYTAQVEP